MSAEVSEKLDVPKSRHSRRSSLSEALHAEAKQESPASTPVSKVGSHTASEDTTPRRTSTPRSRGVEPKHDKHEGKWKARSGGQESQSGSAEAISVLGHSPEGSDHSSKSGRRMPEESTAASQPQPMPPRHTVTEAMEITGRHMEESPFMTEESMSYTLCPDLHRPEGSTPHRVSLDSVPEDAASPPDGAPPADLLQPDALKLPKVRTPRTSGSGDAPAQFAAVSSAAEIEPEPDECEKFSIDFRRERSATLQSFNPFDSNQSGFPLSPLGTITPPEDFFSMDVEPGGAAEAPLEPPQRLALDFGTRSGSGVIGPKLDALPTSRQADKFQVQEGEDAEVKQLLWVIENLNEELQAAVEGLRRAAALVSEQEAVAERFQSELKQAEAEEAEVDEELQTMHSQLEAQLLTKLDQEDDIRVKGDQLKAVRAEIVGLDESLAKAEEERRDLERQAAQRRASEKRDIPEEQGEGDDEEEESQGSPKSLYSSAWGTSDSEEEAPELSHRQASSRPSVSLDEDNEAKLKEKGGLGGSWLRTVLAGRAVKEVAPPRPLSPDPVKAASKQPVVGAGQSHFEQPAAAAEIEAALEEADPAVLR